MSTGIGVFRKLTEFARLARLEGGGFSVVALFGALAAGGGRVELQRMGVLFLINLLFILGGCIHNDLSDLKYDRKAQKLAGRPLVKGTITRPEAVLAATTCFLGCIALGWYLTPSAIAAGALSGAIVLALLYNRFSKTLFGADLFFAASAGFLCVFGGLSGAFDSGFIRMPGGFMWAVTGIVVIDHFFFNALEGGSKDFENDGQAGAPTIVHRLFSLSDGRATLTAGGRVFFFGLKTASIVLVFLPFFALDCPFRPWQIALLTAASVLTLIFTWKLTGLDRTQQDKAARLMRIQEMACRSLVPLMLASIAGAWWTAVLIFAPLLWFFLFNAALYANPFSNPKTD